MYNVVTVSCWSVNFIGASACISLEKSLPNLRYKPFPSYFDLRHYLLLSFVNVIPSEEVFENILSLNNNYMDD